MCANLLIQPDTTDDIIFWHFLDVVSISPNSTLILHLSPHPTPPEDIFGRRSVRPARFSVRLGIAARADLSKHHRTSLAEPLLKGSWQSVSLVRCERAGGHRLRSRLLQHVTAKLLSI